VNTIAALHRRSPLDAVLAVDDQGVVIASAAAAGLGFPHNPPDAVVATRDKRIMRERLGGWCQTGDSRETRKLPPHRISRTPRSPSRMTQMTPFQ
jgi:adenine/guanine phosphoribosyltransferase-like PRPP-binding protein